MNRRDFLRWSALLCASELVSPRKSRAKEAAAGLGNWEEVRRQFRLSKEYIHLGAMLVSTHPEPVQQAIDRHRDNLNSMPVSYLQGMNRRLQREAREAAASYLGARPDEVALTDSTTMGLGLVYTGLRLKPGDELLTSTHDYYVTHQSLRLAAARTRATVRTARLYGHSASASEGEILENLRRALSPRTRVLALTWVHSGTGIKLPLARISELVREANAPRREEERILFCVDGVHGFGVEAGTVGELGCDFFIAGCHKWLFGPRGTGLVWGTPSAWARTRASIPTFLDNASWAAWHAGNPPPLPTTATRMTPGGFKAFEHLWALADAFRFHQQIGKDRIAARTHELARQLKEGLSRLEGITLQTPMSESLSSGIVCFSVRGRSPQQVVRWLLSKKIVATVTPYSTPYVRLSPCLYNTPEEIETVLAALRSFA